MHLNQQNAHTASQLMRARFSAYALQNTAFLLQTWCEKTRPKHLDLRQQPNWIRLVIDDVQQGGGEDKRGWVKFSAFYTLNLNQQGVMQERSRFQRNRLGQWCYVDGKVD
ncbi:MAG: YchJ family metal-binding protein [Thiomicrospira sp.]|nr:YchJ family metal-binding protein [Thiomicrospira sp.]